MSKKSDYGRQLFRLHYRHGAFYYVRRIDGKVKWRRLASLFEQALEMYCEIEQVSPEAVYELRAVENRRPMPRSLSPKIRFAVFERDGFTCRYCGARPPEAKLEIDHVTPVSSGGILDMANLVTACSLCNMGKGKDLLDQKEFAGQPDLDLASPGRCHVDPVGFSSSSGDEV